jgi:Xaa-Pro aminopeptidase
MRHFEGRLPVIDAITADEYTARLEALAVLMAEQSLGALVAFSNRVHPGHVQYLTGYDTWLGIHDSSACVVRADGKSGGARRCALVTNASFDPPEPRSWLDEIFITGDYAAAIKGWLGEPVARLGVAGLPAFPAPFYNGLQAAFPGAEVIDAAPLVHRLRAVKSPGEIAIIRRCAVVNDAGATAFLEALSPGVTEREVAARIDAAMKRAGGDEVSYTTQVGCGPITSRVVMRPSDRRIEAGRLIQVDCGPVYQGYRGDLSRVTFMGSLPDAPRRLLDATLAMYEGALPLLVPGTPAGRVADRVCQIAQEHGLADCLYHSPSHRVGFVGHGIGCGYHEPPEIHPSNETPLQAGMVIVLEPILTDPAVGGVKIEDMILVTESVPEPLSRTPLRPWEHRSRN